MTYEIITFSEENGTIYYAVFNTQTKMIVGIPKESYDETLEQLNSIKRWNL